MVSYALVMQIMWTELQRLNPYCSGQWSRTDAVMLIAEEEGVLILIVVDNGLVQYYVYKVIIDKPIGLNPYCSGQWSRTDRIRLY